MKTIKLFVRDYYTKNVCGYEAIVEHNGKCKLFKRELKGTGDCRIVLSGVLDIIRRLKYPCEITIFTNINFGLSRIQDKRGYWREDDELYNTTNIDLLIKLKQVCLDKGHFIEQVATRRIVDLKFQEVGKQTFKRL